MTSQHALYCMYASLRRFDVLSAMPIISGFSQTSGSGCLRMDGVF